MIYTPTSLRKELYSIFREGNTVQVRYKDKVWRIEVYEDTLGENTKAAGASATAPDANPAKDPWLLGRTRTEIKADLAKLESNFKEEAAVVQDGETAIKLETEYMKARDALYAELQEVTF